ncbi:MAG: epimerase transport system membrane fusion protein [Sulfurimonas sp.]|jgi:epimerase transport system membrane fusion protein|uniref:HlyD family type I secretion periplasmic adaptor subunit n=1 Tax=Sulfurimonas sp. TaxID=2022749 RepID=UPI0039E5AFCF
MQDNQENQMPSHDDSSIIIFGLGLIFTVFILLGGWMYLAPLASSSVAIGTVSADLDKKTIQHLEGGKVTAIYVKDGDKVKKGQLLLKLRDVQIKAQLDILNAQFQDAIALFARLKTQRDNKNTISFPENLHDINAKNDQINIFVTTKKTIKDEKTINQNKIVQLQEQISGLESLILSKQKRSSSILEERLEWEELFKQRLVDKQRIRELKRENNSIDGDLASTRAEVSKLQEQISEVKTQQLLREKEFKKETLIKYVETKSTISDLKSKIIANEDTLERTNIISPIDGTIVGLSLHTVGGIITPSEAILEIVPENAKLLVIAQVQTTDIDKVRTGLIADIMFSAFNLKQVSVIQGRVIHVAADNFIDEVSGMPYYEAKIEVTAEGIKVLNENKFVLVSGMPAQVMIQLGDRTALSYLIKPFTEMLKGSLNEE